MKPLFYCIFAIFLMTDFAKSQTISDEVLNMPNSPAIMLSGFINVSAIARSQSQTYSRASLPDDSQNHYADDFALAGDGKFYVKAGSLTASKIKYGVISELEYDSMSKKDNGLQLSKGFIFGETKLGKLEIGNNLAVNQKMKTGPNSFARALGGINGKYLEYINMPMTESSAPNFILIPQSPIAHGGYAKGFSNDNSATANDYTNYSNNKSANGLQFRNGAFQQMESATKISYYTPRIDGFQLGASFTPNANNTGVSRVATGQNLGLLTNIKSWALNYSNYFGNLGFAASITGEHGQFNNAKIATDPSTQISRHNLNSYDVGATLTYFGFTLGGSYGYWGNSLQPKNGIYANNARASYYTTGIAYEFGPVAASITYFDSKFQKNNYKATSLGIDYKLKRGAMPYLELTRFDFSANNAITNKGYVALAGIMLAL